MKKIIASLLAGLIIAVSVPTLAFAENDTLTSGVSVVESEEDFTTEPETTGEPAPAETTTPENPETGVPLQAIPFVIAGVVLLTAIILTVVSKKKKKK